MAQRTDRAERTVHAPLRPMPRSSALHARARRNAQHCPTSARRLDRGTLCVLRPLQLAHCWAQLRRCVFFFRSRARK